MSPENFDTLTLRLLRLFETIYRTRNVSHAADILGVSQPSVSLSLNRLRQHFDDPLFVRVGAKMEPTPRADKLIEPVRQLLLIAQDEFIAQASFDPANSTRSFTLHMTDLGETIIVPKLVNYLAVNAPGVQLRVREIGETSQSLLGQGSVDLILGFLAKECEDLLQRKLFDERLTGIARADHPRIRGRITPEQWRTEAHIAVSIAGTGRTGIEPGADNPAAEHQWEGQPAALELPGFLAIGAAVAETDMIAAVPSRLAGQLWSQMNIQTFELPHESPSFQVRQYWHPRFHNDSGNRWLRNSVAELFPHSP